MSLIAWYRLENNANDSISGFNGSPSNVTWENISRLGTTCAYFNGINSTINIGTNFIPIKTFTVSIWFKSLGTTPTTGVIPYLLGFTYGIRLRVDNTSLTYGLDDGTSTVVYLTSPANYSFYTDNKWHNVIVCATPNSMKFFIDGVLVGSRSTTWLGFTRWYQVWYLGRDLNDIKYYYTGYMNDVRIYDHEFSLFEAQELYRSKVLHVTFNNNSGINNTEYKEITHTETNMAYSVSKIGDTCYDNSVEAGRYCTYYNVPHCIYDMTYSMWLYPTNNTYRMNPIDRNYGGEGTITHEIAGFFRYYWGSSGGNTTPYTSIDSNYTLPLNQWTHIAAVRDITNGLIKIYANGNKTNEASSVYTSTGVSISNLLIGYGYTTYYRGKIDDVRVYASALTDNDILDLYNRRACIDEQGKIYSFYVKENRDNYDIIENNNNLIENGNGSYGNNYNFTDWTYNESSSSFSKYTTGSGNAYMSVNHVFIYNPYDVYQLECEYKRGDSDLSGLYSYSGYYSRDINFSFINHQQCTFYANSYTTLAADLNNGDSVVYLTSATGWNNTNPGSAYYTKWFVLWPKNNVTYPAYTYSTIYQYYINVDTGINTITLNGTWNGGYIPAGSWCCNGFGGGTYNYSIFNGGSLSAPSTWTRYMVNISTYGPGVSVYTFRTGTKYVKWHALLGYANGSFTAGTTMFRNIKLINKTRTQNIQLLNHAVNVADNYLNTAKIDEIGSADRLVNWFPFNNDFHDYASNVDASVIGNVTLINDNGIYCANFDGTATTYLQYLTGRLYEIPNLYQEWTVCAWFKTSDTTKTLQQLNSFNMYNNVIHSSNRMLLYLNSGTNDYYTYSNSGVFTNNVWYHVAFVFRNMGALRKLYVNGIDVSGTTLTNLSCTPSGIGQYTNIGYNLLGQLRDYRVYDSALTSEEINQIYKLSNLSNKELQITSNYSIHTPKLIETL